MSTDEEELQPLVREDHLPRGFLLRPFNDDSERRSTRGLNSRVPRAIDEAPACGCEKPCLGVIRDPASRPRLERCDERVAKRIFCGRHVARLCSEVGEKPAVGGPGREFRYLTRVDVVSSALAHMGRLGRTSTTPVEAAGQRAALSRVRSRG